MWELSLKLRKYFIFSVLLHLFLEDIPGLCRILIFGYGLTGGKKKKIHTYQFGAYEKTLKHKGRTELIGGKGRTYLKKDLP